MKSSTSVVSSKSIAQSTASQVEVKLATNEKKAQIRQLMKNIDVDKSGIVKEEAFFTILQLHGIILTQEEQNKLKKNHARAGKIDFKDALHAVNIDLDSAVLKEEKWQVAKQDGKAQNAEVSQAQKSVTHLSRLNLEEFQQRQSDFEEAKPESSQIGMNKLSSKDLGIPGAGNIQPSDSVSKAGSTISKPVAVSNQEMLNEFRAKFGKLTKNRPDLDLENVSVATPPQHLYEGLNQEGPKGEKSKQMTNFIQTMAKTDKALYDKLLSLMKLFNMIDVDLRQVQVLKAAFIQKDKSTLPQIPISKFQDSVRASFKHFRQQEDAVAKICDVVCVERSTENGPQDFADSSKLATLIEFMRCYPMVIKRDKNASSNMNSVMTPTADKGNKAKEKEPMPDDTYVRQLVELVWTRLQERYKTHTNAYRFLDQRSKGKVKRTDLQQGLEKTRISLSREDVTKIFNFLDVNRQGYLTYQDFCQIDALSTKAMDPIETRKIENQMSNNYQVQQNNEQAKQMNSPQTSNYSGAQLEGAGMNNLFASFKQQQAAEPQKMKKVQANLNYSQDHTFGAQQIPSDNMNNIMEQQFAAQYAAKKADRDAAIREQYQLEHKKIKNKPTKTSIIRAIASKKLVQDLDQSYPEYASVLKEKRLRGLSQVASSTGIPREKGTPDRYSNKMSNKGSALLPALNKRGASEKPPSQCQSRGAMGSYTTDRLSRNPQVEKVLFPTQNKDTFLQRNAHLASQQMTQLAAEHAKAQLSKMDALRSYASAKRV